MTCYKTKTYPTKAAAHSYRRRYHPNGKWLEAYYCDEHRGYHLGRNMRGILARAHREGFI